MVTTPDLDSDKKIVLDEQCFPTSLQRWHESLGQNNNIDSNKFCQNVERKEAERKVKQGFNVSETNKEKCRAVPKQGVSSTKYVNKIVHTNACIQMTSSHLIFASVPLSLTIISRHSLVFTS